MKCSSASCVCNSASVTKNTNGYDFHNRKLHLSTYTSHSPCWGIPSWPEWSRAWRNPWCCASRRSPAPHQAGAGHSRWRGRQQSTLSFPPAGTTAAAPRQVLYPLTQKHTAWHPTTYTQKTRRVKLLSVSSFITTKKIPGADCVGDRNLVEFVFFAELHTLLPAVVAFKKVGSNSPELNELMLL